MNSEASTIIITIIVCIILFFGWVFWVTCDPLCFVPEPSPEEKEVMMTYLTCLQTCKTGTRKESYGWGTTPATFVTYEEECQKACSEQFKKENKEVK